MMTSATNSLILVLFLFSTMMNQISVFIHVLMECIREDDVLQFWIMSHFPVLLKVYKMA